MLSDLGVMEEPVAEKESGQVVEVENEEEEEELGDNSKSTNHPIIHMFHRAAIECELPALCSKRQDFRVFQQIWRDLATNTKDPSLRELALFSQVYSGKIHDFGRRKQENLYRTFLFWKTSQEVTEIQE